MEREQQYRMLKNCWVNKFVVNNLISLFIYCKKFSQAISMKIKREIKIGILSAFAVFVLFWGINFLKGKKIFSGSISFYTILDETKGLASSNPVTLNGIKIGQITKVYFHPDGSGRVLAKSSIENQKLVIPANSTALVRQPGLVGEMEIAIKLGDSTIALQNGDTLQAVFIASLTDNISDQILPLTQKVGSLIAQADSVFYGVRKLFDNKNIESIAKSLENLSQITQSLANNSAKIDGMISSGNHIMEELKKSSNEVSIAVKNFSGISNELAAANLGQILQNASESMKSFNNLLQKVQTSNGSLNLLLEDKELYINLKESTRQLELLLEDVRKNPKNYINFSVF
jgi:phospholipid/cholesterol/gamma-HCH transport system substrate-binding protein